ncbi:MAG TPA: MFS transporter [Mycobacteriales bacterium]|nr:MFS transporter [Mycobacteriales bacterium]
MADRIEQSYWQALQNRRLTLLIGGDMVSKVGDGMVIVALPLQTLRIHSDVNPALAVALIEAAPYVLAVAVSLAFGLGRRRFRPRALLTTDCVLRFTVLSGLALLAMAGQLPLWLLGAALFAGSGLRLLAASSRRLVATGMAGIEGRFAVNGLLGTSDSLTAYVIGPVLGGILATAVSPGFVMLLDGLSFAGLLVVVLVAVPPGTSETVRGPRGSASGWTILRRIPIAAWLFAVVFLFNLFYMPIEVALPLLVRGPLHASGAALGGIWTGFGVGALVGALATNHLRRLPQTALLVAIIAGWGCCVGVLAAAPNIGVAVGAFAIGGLIYAPFTPVAYSLVQSRLDADQQQPVLTLWAAGSAVASPIGLLLGGPLIQLTGTRTGILVSALLTLALVPAAGHALRRAGRAGVMLG